MRSEHGERTDHKNARNLLFGALAPIPPLAATHGRFEYQLRGATANGGDGGKKGLGMEGAKKKGKDVDGGDGGKR